MFLICLDRSRARRREHRRINSGAEIVILAIAFAPGSTARFRILYDGKPLSGQTVTLFREAGLYDGRKEAGTATSDAAGIVAMTPPNAGRYLMLVRYRTAIPDPAGGYASFTTTLAFEAG